MSDIPHDGYEVGRGKPPKAHRWKPGQSGNPSGRRKPKLTDAELIAKIRDEPMKIKIHGRERRVSVLEAAIRATVAKTISRGTPRDLEQLLRVLEKYGALPAEVVAANARAAAEDCVLRIMEVFERTVPDDVEGEDGQCHSA